MILLVKRQRYLYPRGLRKPKKPSKVSPIIAHKLLLNIPQCLHFQTFALLYLDLLSKVPVNNCGQSLLSVSFETCQAAVSLLFFRF